jgi:hypothetical protein
VALGEFPPVLADVDQHALLAVDQLHRLGRADGGTLAARGHRDHSSMPPDTTAATTRNQFSIRKFSASIPCS